MAAPVFIGDEVTAAGYWLAGAQIHTPGPEQAGEVLRQLSRAAPLILITAEYADRLPAAVLDELLAGFHPPLVIVPDARGAVPLPDLAAHIRTHLGLGE